MPDSIVYLNGEFLPRNEAYVPVLDRGFIFGDGVYEVIPVYAGNAFRLAHHLQRLQDSLDAVRIDNPYSNDEWAAVIEGVIEQNGSGDQSVYLQVTRGVAMREHEFPDSSTQTVFIMSNPLHSVSLEKAEKGITTITLEDIRWQYCNIKSIALLPNILLRQQAVDQGSGEAILLRDGEVTEGAASNVFIVKNGTIKTPPKSGCLLPGITRDLVVELAQENNIPCEEIPVSEAELRDADEIWVTSSTKEILPVLQMDNEAVSGGKAGPMWRRMFNIYQAYKQALRQPLGA